MFLFSIFSTTEHFIVLMAFLFPPTLFTVMLVIFLATFGKSLGLRERYVTMLIRIFEWGAGEIDTVQQRDNESSNKCGFHLGPANYDDDLSDLESDELELSIPDHLSHNGDFLSRSVYEIPPPHSPDSGVLVEPSEPPMALAGSIASTESLRKDHFNGSSASLNSSSSSRMRNNSGIIKRETNIQFDEEDVMFSIIVNSSPGWQAVRDSMYFIKAGVEAIIEDEVTSRFQAEQLASWNLLTRTSLSSYQFLSWRLTFLWGVSFFFRYFFLLPMRLAIFSVALTLMIFGTAVIGIVPNSRLKRWMNRKCMLMCMRIGSRAFSTLIFYYNQHNRADNGICVANHTSPIDVMILGTDNAYAMIGQRHSGFMGIFQRALSRASSHIWFERFEAKDRAGVAKRLKDHVQDLTKLPMLIFPEGTCINNSAVMMFKKGCFEVEDAKIYPIALKYDSRFGDAFWNSSEQGYIEYMFRMMTSWALICHVWYLPPMERMPHESAIDFAKRVQKAIATSGGLVDLEWDGQLKRSRVPEKFIDQQRDKYYRCYQRYSGEE